MRLYTIYKYPIDYPNDYVVRAFNCRSFAKNPIPDKNIFFKGTLEECRGSIPGLRYRLGRDVNDDPCILETYV